MEWVLAEEANEGSTHSHRERATRQLQHCRGTLGSPQTQHITKHQCEAETGSLVFSVEKQFQRRQPCCPGPQSKNADDAGFEPQPGSCQAGGSHCLCWSSGHLRVMVRSSPTRVLRSPDCQIASLGPAHQPWGVNTQAPESCVNLDAEPTPVRWRRGKGGLAPYTPSFSEDHNSVLYMGDQGPAQKLWFGSLVRAPTCSLLS